MDTLVEGEMLVIDGLGLSADGAKLTVGETGAVDGAAVDANNLIFLPSSTRACSNTPVWTAALVSSCARRTAS